MTDPKRPRLRLAGVGLSPDESASLRSLLGLLDRYLKSEWVLSEATQADLVLVRLDGDPPVRPHPAWPAWIGCVHRPRQRSERAIHRPLRSSELLAVLQQHESAGSSGPRELAAAGSRSIRILRLEAWPERFEAWPPARLRVLAAMSGAPIAYDELPMRTGTAADEVDRCLAELSALGILHSAHVRAECAVAASKPAPPWRRLFREIGARLRIG